MIDFEFKKLLEPSRETRGIEFGHGDSIRLAPFSH
jgi:hypothetical protein